MKDIRFKILEYLVRNDNGDYIDVVQGFKPKFPSNLLYPKEVDIKTRRRIYSIIHEFGREGYVDHYMITGGIHWTGDSPKQTQEIFDKEDEQLKKSIDAKITQKGYEEYQKLHHNQRAYQIGLLQMDFTGWRLIVAIIAILVAIITFLFK